MPDPKIDEVLRTARRDLYKAGGLPLNPVMTEEDRRRTAIEDLDKFVFDRFRLRQLLPFGQTTIWHNSTARSVFNTPEAVFHLEKIENSVSSLPRNTRAFLPSNCKYRLIHISEPEKILVELDGNDPEFANRLLVAIADAAEKESEA
jgi:hypothetical protein